MNNHMLSPVHTFGGLINDLFNGREPRFFKDDFLTEDWNKSKPFTPVNIREDENSYHLEVIAPGLEKEDLKVQVKDDVLSISYEEKTEDKQEGTTEEGIHLLREEFRTRSFKRSFEIGDSVDVDHITAEYSKGILRLTLPKKEEKKSLNKMIEIG